MSGWLAHERARGWKMRTLHSASGVLENNGQKKVQDIAPREEARSNGWKIIKTRRIGITKGDDVEVS